MRRQAGQALVLLAIMMAVLVGFVGLAIDGGEATSQQQLARDTADGASLAAAYAIAVQGTSEAAATTLAQDVVAANRLPTSSLTLAYLDSTGAATPTPSSVATVQATVSLSSLTFFLGAVGIPNLSISATASASTTVTGGGGGGGGGACALCLMKASGTTLTTASGATITSTGAIQVNSNGVPAVRLGNNSRNTASAVYIAAGGTVSYGSNASFTPAPTTKAPIADPYSSLAVPSLSGAAANYTAPAGTPSIGPELYGTITVPSGSTLTLTAGTYVVTGGIAINGGAIVGTGVTIYLACPAYPTACLTGASGANITLALGSTITLSPPITGAYAGITVFADRKNAATNTMNGSSATVGGTWYSLAMPFSDTHPGDVLSFGQMVTATLTLANNSTLGATGALAAGGSVGLSK